MFGFGQDAAAKKRISDMAAMIRGTAGSFGQIAALHATLNRVSGRDPGDRYLVVILGFADQVGRKSNADTQTTHMALRAYLSKYPDGEQVFNRMIRLSSDREFRLWQDLAAQTLAEIFAGNDSTSTMLRFVAKYTND